MAQTAEPTEAVNDQAECASDCKRQGSASTASTPSLFRQVLPAAGGSFIEWYEFAIYFYLHRYITGNFFPEGRGGSLGTWAGFAVTFAFRPLGGIFAGALADLFGRKPAMQLTIALMLVATFVQGCLPTFLCCGEAWGWFGLAALLFLRALQGLSAGGELSTAAVYLGEVCPKASLGLSLSSLSVAGAFGAWSVAALVAAGFEASMGKAEMMRWGWRMPYLTSLLPGVALVLSRRMLTETADFEELLKEQVHKSLGGGGDAEAQDSEHAVSEAKADHHRRSRAMEGAPVAEVLANYKLAVAIGSLGISGVGAFWYVPALYGISFIGDRTTLSPTITGAAEVLCFLVPAVLSPVVGMCIDKWGAGKVYACTVFFCCVLAPPPLFYWWAHVSEEWAVPAVLFGQVLLGLLLAPTSSVYLWLVELFPVHVRATGVSIAYNIGIGIFGGLGPLLCDMAGEAMPPSGVLSAPAAFTLFAGLLSAAAVLASRALGRRGALKLTHLRHTPY